MGLGGCILMIAVGGILTFATDWNASGFNVQLVGLILMAVGIIGTSAYVSVYKRRRVVEPTAVAPPVVEESDHHRHHHY
ncbi:hypothetical protein ACFV27_26605 [Streptomyces antimycoticus]|uniref:Membrane protein n=5 Tax=Streptomyces TaxID=1883 RepID=A0A4D4K0P4_9ACTN|nr:MULTISPECIES: hypothetical protein [Streptomyces]MEE4584171.1 hypothetical protein [Streptomyces sp. DSM 41602]AJZ84330.1 hypothetical protein AS97_20795 [Streptomyces sp. AgN23]KUL45254.1 hypothetical protein ADL28_37620 [Streptomyces violaceusniger]RSS36954.1 hypothetical protein EF902_33975 [Streptomyces sp. WAC05858]WJE01643.1 hypothetical protein QR300_40105 [Streptomyces antimycoticus]